MHFANSKKTAGCQKVCRQPVEKVRCSALSLQSLFALHLGAWPGEIPKETLLRKPSESIAHVAYLNKRRQKSSAAKNYAAAFSFSLPSSFPIKNEEIVTVTSEHAILTGGR